MWENTVEQGRPQMTKWRKSIACWISKGTNIHSEHVIRIAFQRQQWLHEIVSTLRYTYVNCLVKCKMAAS